MKIAVTGATGLVGSALVPHLQAQGHEIIRIVRSNPTGTDVQWNPAFNELSRTALEGVEGVVHLAGAGLGDKRWTPEHKKAILDSRVQSTELIANVMALLDPLPKVLLSASAIGFYGNRGDNVMNEYSEPGDGFLVDVVKRWEEATAEAEKAGIRVVHLRTGIVQATQGGQLAKQLPFFKLGAGGRLGSGHQWVSWISLDDEIAAIAFLLTSSMNGAVNLVAPNPVTNAEYTKILGSVVHRPTLFPTPTFAPKLLFGSEMVEEMILASTRVSPTRLIEAGFVFSDPQLEPALKRILAK